MKQLSQTFEFCGLLFVTALVRPKVQIFFSVFANFDWFALIGMDIVNSTFHQLSLLISELTCEEYRTKTTIANFFLWSHVVKMKHTCILACYLIKKPSFTDDFTYPCTGKKLSTKSFEFEKRKGISHPHFTLWFLRYVYTYQ